MTDIFNRITAFFTAICTLLVFGPNTKAIPEKADDDIRIVTYNLKFAYSEDDTQKRAERIETLSKQIINYAPDSIGFQEADKPWMGLDGKGLPDYLKDYAYVGLPRQDSTGEYAPIFYLKDKYTLIDSGTFWFSDTPQEHSLTWNSDMERICTWATLENKTTKKRFTHMNLHFDLGSESRDKSTDLLLKYAAEFDTPVIITGDFNMEQDCDNYNKILNAGFFDSKKEAADTMDFGTYNGFHRISCRFAEVIDFVFVRKDEGLSAKSYRVDNSCKYDFNYVSDHLPVIVDLTYSG